MSRVSWTRKVLIDEKTKLLQEISARDRAVLEISGERWEAFGFKSYTNIFYPEFDICRDVLPSRFDLIIAEQVFEHVRYPWRAAKHVREMLRDDGYFLISTPFLLRIHAAPNDYWRWTPQGMQALLEDAGFSEVKVGSWGNRDCISAAFDAWPKYREGYSLRNEPKLPVVVWALAHK